MHQAQAFPLPRSQQIDSLPLILRPHTHGEKLTDDSPYVQQATLMARFNGAGAAG